MRARSLAESVAALLRLDQHRTLGWDEPGHGAQKRGLAGAVGSDQNREFAGTNVEADAVDDDLAGQPDDDVLQREGGRFVQLVSPPKNARCVSTR